MRSQLALALIATSTVVTIVGVGAAHASSAPSAAPSHVAPTAAGCVLPAADGASVAVADRRAPSSHHQPARGAGNLVVTIPAAVFIRAQGDRLVVTTNTARPPQPGDTFYFIANHHAAIASRALQHDILDSPTCQDGARSQVSPTP
jgi:hypothetical protein